MTPRLLLALLTLWGADHAAAAQASVPPSSAMVQFQFDHPGAAVPVYTIVLQAGGAGTYSEGTLAATPIHVGPATVQRVLAARGSLGAKGCETKMKKIANTGRKTLSYSGDGAPVSCVYNYSDMAPLNDVASAFIALAETLQAGVRLAAKHRFDRLGLDLEMETLDNELRDGRALEIGNISPVLNSIVNDDRVIERVRRRAARMLQDSTPSEAASTNAVPAPNER